MSWWEEVKKKRRQDKDIERRSAKVEELLLL